MSKVIALTRTVQHAALDRSHDIARGMIVTGCAAALILAGQPLPF